MINLPQVALIGRANVGKSTLFNKCIEEDKSMVSPVAGTTRDRFESECLWKGLVFNLVDTGGLDADKTKEIEKNIVKQAEIAIKKAAVIIFVLDVQVGPTVEDLEIASLLHKTKKPIIVVANKAENAELRSKVDGPDWRSWPMQKPLPLSAKQGTGVGDMLDLVQEQLEKIKLPAIPVSQIKPMRVAVFGEPNVGKSTLLNALVGEERFITANVPHTTREPNDVTIVRQDKTYVFIDTAGVRKHARMVSSRDHLEIEGVERTLEALDRADIALFVINVNKEISAQERHLAGILSEHGVSTIIIANQWDLVKNKTTTTINEAEKRIRGFLPQLKYAPIIFTSALHKQRTENIFNVIATCFAARFTTLSDSETRSFMARSIMKHKPSKGKGVKHPKITSFTQTRTNPPRFALAVNLSRKDSLADSYLRFLENQLREHYDFTGTPIRIRVEVDRKSHTTY